MMQESELPRGSTNRGLVVRVGDTIRRPRSAGSGLVEALLLHLEDVGWRCAPRFLGIDDADRQVLTFVRGRTHRQPPWQTDDVHNAAQLGHLAALLRTLHEATATFRPPSEESSKRPLPLLGSTWTHGDPGYPNVVYDDEAVVGLIDWEFAGAADPLCDLAALLAVSVRGPRPDADDHVRRAKAVALAATAIADNYGLTDEQVGNLGGAAAMVLDDAALLWQTADAPMADIDRLGWRAEWYRNWSGI